MGVHNSSKTRVRPIFRALSRSDNSGGQWLGKLMSLGGRAAPDDPGTLIVPPLFEFLADPPRDFLAWLVSHPESLSVPSYPTSESTQRKREALLEGNASARAAALAKIKDITADHWPRWLCFEGTTKVDCALLTRKLVLFIEGKRTETGPSPNISWYRGRDQVLRNLDCARWYAQRYGLDYYAMLIIEGDDESKRAAARNVESERCVRSSLPHLTKSERADAMKHYLGFSTWDEVGSLIRATSLV